MLMLPIHLLYININKLDNLIRCSTSSERGVQRPKAFSMWQDRLWQTYHHRSAGGNNFIAGTYGAAGLVK